MIPISKIKKLPDAPGVYIFKDGKGKILYVGKATSLRSRVRSYFTKDIIETRGPLILKMIEVATRIDHLKTDSVLEALILEANLIKKNQPFYNTKEKDDKSYNFVIVTDEDFPRVLVMRGREIKKMKENAEINKDTIVFKEIFGPFPNGSALRVAMKIVRRIFPFRDKCVPATDSKSRPCFNRQIGLCPGVCSGEITKKEYYRIIKHLMMFFEGKKKALLKSLEKEMSMFAKQNEFEKASMVKRTVFALRHIQDVALIKDDQNFEKGGTVSIDSRIEAYDIAHFGGNSTVGVMTVVENGEAVPAQYRMFKVQQKSGGDDLKSLGEILTRRFSHPEWGTPSLVVVDGGQTHLNYATKLIRSLNIKSPIVSVVKDEKHNPRDVLWGVSENTVDIKSENDNKLRAAILLANSESHRFAIKFHKKTRNRSFLPPPFLPPQQF